MYKRLCLRCGGCGHHCLVITITEKQWEDEVPLLRNTGRPTLAHALAGGGA